MKLIPLSLGDRVQTLGKIIKNMPITEKAQQAVSKNGEFANSYFKFARETGLQNFQAGELLCGHCELRNSYLNKISRSAYNKD